jgi:hypothetical protein
VPLPEAPARARTPPALDREHGAALRAAAEQALATEATTEDANAAAAAVVADDEGAVAAPQPPVEDERVGLAALTTDELQQLQADLGRGTLTPLLDGG